MTTQYEAVPTEIIHSEEKEAVESLNIHTANNNGPIFGKRHEQTLLLGFLWFLLSCIKASMSIAIVAINDPSASINPDVPTYNWTDKGTVLSCFLWGYMVPQVGGGWLAGRYGSKWILVGTTIACGLLNLLLPTVVYSLGSKGVMVCRFLQGVTQGIIPSAIYGLMGKWAPPQERSKLGTVIFGGSTAGILVVNFTSGYLAASWYGWPMIFYVNASLGILWSIIFSYIGKNSPADHPSITYEERFFIDNNLPSADENKKLSTPWIKIMGSPNFWAILAAHCAYNWALLLMITELPTYFKHVMKFDIKANGVMSTLPHVVKCLMSFVFTLTADMFIAKGIWSIGTSRKSMQFIGSFGPCIALIILGQCRPGDSFKAVVTLITLFGFLSASISGYCFNHLDIAPNHAGVLMGITNQFSTFCAAIGLTTLQYIVTDEENPKQWGILFYFTAGLFVSTAIIFCVFASGEVQPWNDEIAKCDSSKNDENKL